MVEFELKGFQFLVSENGEVFRKSDKKKYKPLENPRFGYLQICAYENGRRTTIMMHRLVALAFLGERPEGMFIDHIDRNKKNNHPSNLRYVTPRENAHNSARTKKYSYSKKENTYRSSILIEGQAYHLGTFKDMESAVEAYDSALSEYDNNGKLPERIKRSENYHGIYETKYGTFKVYAWPNGEKVFLGTYKKKDEAGEAANKYLATHGPRKESI